MTAAARIVQQVTRRGRALRPVRAGAWHLGRALATRQRLLETTIVTGSPIAVLSGDPAHRHIFFYGIDEADVTAVVRERLRPGAVVLDIGANAGFFSFLARDLGAAAVHAFEPNPGNVALLRRSLALRPGVVEVVPAACSDRPGTLPLHLPTGGDTATGSVQPDGSQPLAGTVDVPVTTVDEHVAAHGLRPTFLKVDVERHELAVLRGARRTLEAHRPLVVAEVTDPEALAYARDLGYRASRITPEGLLPADDLGPDGWANLLLEPV